MTVATSLFLAAREKHQRDVRAYLFVGIILGWGASAFAYAVASRYAEQCFEVTVPTYSAPAVARPVLPGT